MTNGIAIAHDYATQYGGGERVALMMAHAFPGSLLYTAVYNPKGTFPEFAEVPVRTTALSRVPLFRRNHWLAFPLLAPVVSMQRVHADVLLVSSSGWAHGYRGARRTVVYCYAPARWLYQTDRYLAGRGPGIKGWARDRLARASLAVLGPSLKRWDARAAGRADKYLTVSTVIRDAIADVYGIEAEVLPPPPAMLPGGLEQEIPGIRPGFLLCVARLLPYKNVDKVILGAQRLGGPDLVVVGEGPDRSRLEALIDPASPAKMHLVGRIDDPSLRWLYRNCSALVAASYEDFGLSPLEANSFGRPAVTLRGGGFLDTVREGVTGTYFDTLDAEAMATAIDATVGGTWNSAVLEAHAADFSEERFARRLHEVVEEQQRLP